MAFRVGLVVGSITTFVGFVFMLWTESLVARHLVALDQHHPHIVKVDDCDVVDPKLNGSVVYLQGRLDVPLPIRIPDYKLTVHAVKLKRRVQMYQWVELPKDRTDYLLDPLEDEAGGVEDAVFTADDVTYIKDWRNEVVNFTGKQAAVLADIIRNPTYFPITNHLFLAEIVKVGAYRLSDYFVENYFNFYREITGHERPDDPAVKLHAGLYYHTANIWEPLIGDVRLRFAFAGNGGLTRGRGTPISVVGRLIKDTVYPFEDQHGNPMAVLHEDWDPLDDVIHLEKSTRARPMVQSRILSSLVFALGASVLLVYANRWSVTSVCWCTVVAFAGCWLFHWPYHSLALLLSAGVSYVLMSQNPEVNERPLHGKRRIPS